MSEATIEPIRVLFVEDLEVDVERALHQLRRAGLSCTWRRVETGPALVAALEEFGPTIVLSDFSLPQYDGMAALKLVREHMPEVPFVFLSGTIGEERAIAALHAGAVDYVLKENMARLAPAVRRAIGEAEAAAERRRQQAQIVRLNRVLRMLSGVNALVLRVRERIEMLRETCRLAVSVGGYATAIAAAKVPGQSAIQPVAWSGIDDAMTRDLCAYVAQSATDESSVVGRVIRTGREFVCNNTSETGQTVHFDALMIKTGMLSVVAMPLVVDNTAIGVLLLAAREPGVVAEEELTMLREVAGNLSFGLQYLQRDTRARFLSHFDPQTGLAKRPLFCERVQRSVGGKARKAARHAVVVMDIERLSVINDSFGRRTGDLLLQHVADRLKQHFPKTDQVAHFGGGTFALLRAQVLGGGETAAAVHELVHRLFSEPFQIEGHAIPVAMRAGFALCPDHGEDATTLVQNAEAALRLARIAGEQQLQYDPAARSQDVGRLALEHRLRFALERQEFELHYQPKVELATGRIRGAEALLRWRSPEDGLVMPGVFLPLLESTGLIVQVGEWVIQQAARDCQAWMKAGLPPVRVAVNIAPAQLRHLEFEAGFMRAAAPLAHTDWGIDIEITEGMLQDSVAEVAVLKRLRAAGVRIAIDDFGMGYSSLGRLAALPIDTLKIDRSFVRQSVGSDIGAGLIRTIIDLARSFDMTTVAEGVERPEELELLQRLGCDQSQGFLHSPAIEGGRFAEALQRGIGVGPA